MFYPAMYEKFIRKHVEGLQTSFFSIENIILHILTYKANLIRTTFNYNGIRVTLSCNTGLEVGEYARIRGLT